MAEEKIFNIEVDGKQLQARPGQMLIEVTDQAGIDVPRFCYHKKLSIAANCRMCLVEVDKAPKPLPACATPVADGMRVFTHSTIAREAQRGTMEFLLINHPLDCPICDQGGECELQDVAMGYGGDVSRFSERKRVVPDEDIGPLIATDMTRCIHCTRCVRFGAEIAGLREIGATGRGEHMRIGVFVEQAVASELSGNVIDLCPVGALTSKPYRFTARSWELVQREGIAPHDGVGSNILMHVRRDRVLRVVPRENDAVNETWISDRDRFSYQGLYSEDRLEQPLARVGGRLQPVEWEEGLDRAARVLRETDPKQLGALVSPNSTLEEMFLTQQLIRGLGGSNIDHRLRQIDFRHLETDPAIPWLGSSFADLEENDVTLLVGSWLRKEQPLLNHRIRKSVLNGGSVMAINPVAFDFNYEVAVDIVAPPSQMVKELAGVAAAVGADTCGLDVQSDDAHRAMADALQQAERGQVLLGGYAHAHPDFTLLRELSGAIAQATQTRTGYLLDGANAVGGWAAGALPHRGPGGANLDPGLNVRQMIADGLATFLLVGIEPEFDLSDPMAAQMAFSNARVVALASHLSPALATSADVVLPLGAFAETSGSFVNLQGDIQGFAGAVAPVGQARPGWKILRVLGNLLGLQGFDYQDSASVLARARQQGADRKPDNQSAGGINGSAPVLESGSGLERIGGVSIYASDALVRRADALQRSPDAWERGLRICPSLANSLDLTDGDLALLSQGETSTSLPAFIDDRIPDNCVWLPMGVPGSEILTLAFGSVTLEKA